MKIRPEEVSGREFRFAHLLPPGPDGRDLHLVKEWVHFKDGRDPVPNLRLIQDFTRPWWRTQHKYQLHTDKKEYEYESKLDKYMVRQSDLVRDIARKTGKSHFSRISIGELNLDPYIYGSDVTSTTYIHKTLYRDRYPDLVRKAFTYAAFDCETNVFNDIGDIIIGTVAMAHEVHGFVRRDFFEGMPDEMILKVCTEAIAEKLGEHIEEYKLVITMELVDTEIDIVRGSFQWFHARKPDWVGIWNIDFDITKILAACKRAEVDPKEILCDPSVPWDYRICRYKPAKKNKVSAGGVSKQVLSHDQWNYFYLTASFTFIDGMSTYRLLRLGNQEESSYSLDAILDKVTKGKIRKVKHAPTDRFVKLRWHMEMQKNWKAVYVAYALWDPASMCVLDRETNDLSYSLPAMADLTDFNQCNSQPKRLRDSFHFFALDSKMTGKPPAVSGTTGYDPLAFKKPEPVLEDDDEEGVERRTKFDEEDEENSMPSTLGRRGWVLTLASYLSGPGLSVIKGMKNVVTFIRGFVYDSDAVSSYPSCTMVGNVAKVCTRKEITSVGNYSIDYFRMQNINLMTGEVNAIEYTTSMFGAPTLNELSNMYDKDQAVSAE